VHIYFKWNRFEFWTCEPIINHSISYFRAFLMCEATWQYDALYPVSKIPVRRKQWLAFGQRDQQRTSCKLGDTRVLARSNRSWPPDGYVLSLHIEDSCLVQDAFKGQRVVKAYAAFSANRQAAGSLNRITVQSKDNLWLGNGDLGAWQFYVEL
jgi:hypothetical protein